MPAVKETQLRYLEYLHREDGYRHHRYDEEMLQYHFLREGDQAAVPESVRMWTSGLVGKTSEDTIRNRKYLFVASITLACRAAIFRGPGGAALLRHQRPVHPAGGQMRQPGGDHRPAQGHVPVLCKRGGRRQKSGMSTPSPWWTP